MNIGFRAQRSRLRAVLVIALIGVLLTACGSSESKPSGGSATSVGNTGISHTGGTLTTDYDFTYQGGFNFDPRLSIVGLDVYLQHMVFGGLFWLNSDGSLRPDLASGYQVISPTVLEVTLRPGLTFQDGTPLTADVVKANVERTATGQGYSILPVIKAPSAGGTLQSIDVLSPTVLRFTLLKPQVGELAVALGGLGGVMVDPMQFNSKSLDSAPIGAGPYKVQSYTPNVSLKLTASASYWDAKDVQIKNVEYEQVSAQQPQLAANLVETGQLDYAEAQIDVPTLRAAAHGPIAAYTAPSGTNYFWFNICKQPYKTLTAAQTAPFGDLNVRTAMNLMIDRQALNEAIYDGESQPRTQNWLKGEPFYDSRAAEAFTYDPARAKKLMAKSAFPHGFSFSVVVNTDPIGNRIVQYLQQQWAQLGIKMNLIQSLNIGADWFVGLKAPAVTTPFVGVGSLKLINTYDSQSGTNDACGWTKQQPFVDELEATPPDAQSKLKAVWQSSAENVASTQSEIMLLWGLVEALYNKTKVANLHFTVDGIGASYIDPTRSTLLGSR